MILEEDTRIDLITKIKEKSSTKFIYNSSNQLISENSYDGILYKEPKTIVVSYSYNQDGKVSKISYSTGEEFFYEYNNTYYNATYSNAYIETKYQVVE